MCQLKKKKSNFCAPKFKYVLYLKKIFDTIFLQLLPIQWKIISSNLQSKSEDIQKKIKDGHDIVFGIDEQEPVLLLVLSLLSHCSMVHWANWSFALSIKRTKASQQTNHHVAASYWPYSSNFLHLNFKVTF